MEAESHPTHPPNLIPLDVAARRYSVGKSTLYDFLRRKRLTRWRRPGDRRTLLDPRELARFFEPVIID